NFRGARLVIRQDPSRCRKNGNSEAIIYPREVDKFRIDPPAGLRYPRDLADHRFAVDIFQLDLQLGDPGPDGFVTEAPYIPLAFQYFEHIRPEFRGRCRDHGLTCPLSIANPGQHISQRVAHRHRLDASYQLDFTMPGICPDEAS